MNPGHRVQARPVVWALALYAFVPHVAEAQTQWTSGRPDGHAPIGVMGDHTHEAGEFMLSYRFMRMNMDGNRTGTEEASTSEVLAAFPVSPLRMPMDMHMFGVMVAPSDRVTFLVMVPYLQIDMDHVTRTNVEFTTHGSGIGDVSVGGLIGLKREGSVRAHLNAAVSIPTGSIEVMDVTPASSGNEVQLPYPMQLGSGTFDVKPGLTLLGMGPRASWGAQAIGTVRIGSNDHDYTLGNRVDATAWGAVRLNEWVSASLRGHLATWGDVDGQDPAPSVNPAQVPTARADLRGGTRFDLPVGLNLYVPTGGMKGHRLEAEFGVPVYQDLHGPQLQTTWSLTVGWQKSFN